MAGNRAVTHLLANVQRAMVKSSIAPLTYQHRSNNSGPSYEYLGDNLFRDLATRHVYRYNEKLDTLEAGDAAAQERTGQAQPWWPAETAALEPTGADGIRKSLGLEPFSAPGRDSIWRGLRVASRSIRNFEEGANEERVDSGGQRIVLARRSFIGTANVAQGLIFLSPLVGGHREDNTEHPDDFTPGTALTAGEFMAPLQDTRNISLPEKIRRKKARHESWYAGVVHSSMASLLASGKLKPFPEAPNLLGGLDTGATMRALEHARPRVPIGDLEGSAHNQLRAFTSREPGETLGFTVTKISRRHAVFKDTSGTLNEAHFRTLGIPPNWKQVIMEVISRDLGVALQEKGRAAPGTELFTMPPPTSNLRTLSYPHDRTAVSNPRDRPVPVGQLIRKNDRIEIIGRKQLGILTVTDPITEKEFDAKEASGRYRRFLKADEGIRWRRATS